MTLAMTDINDIKELYFKKGLNVAEIMRKTGHDRKTINKYLDMTDFYWKDRDEENEENEEILKLLRKSFIKPEKDSVLFELYWVIKLIRVNAKGYKLNLLDSSSYWSGRPDIIIEGENIECGYNVLRDYFVFTNKRLILVDKQGVAGNKKEFHSIPFKNIRHFSIESAGTFDRDSELKLWIAGVAKPIQKKFGKKSSNIFEVQQALAKHILK